MKVVYPKSAPVFCKMCGKKLAQSPSKRGKSGLCHICAVSRPFDEIHKQKISQALKGYKKTPEHKLAISKACKTRYRNHPEKVPWWKGGKRSFYHKIARQVMGISDPSIVVHHIDGDMTNNHPSNLMALTTQEHIALHNLQGRGTKASTMRWRKLKEENIRNAMTMFSP